MSLLADYEIVRLARTHKMIDPFFSEQQRVNGENKPGISYGLSSYGYDMRVAAEFYVSQWFEYPSEIDPKAFDEGIFNKVCAEEYCVIPAHGFALARSVEYFTIPCSILGVCAVKSTYARCGLLVHGGVLEPEWEGHVTIEISNTTPHPVKVYANEGIAQVMFHRAAKLCDVTYAMRNGKYQGQRGIVTAKV
jgi:dCTP deaminase